MRPATIGTPILAATLAGSALAATGESVTDMLVNQVGAPGGGLASQDFTDFPSYACAGFDDFTIAATYRLNELHVLGTDNGMSSANVDVVARIHVVPDLGIAALAEVHGVQVGMDLVFDMSGIVLGPGTYWVSAQVVRPFNPGGQWYWQTNAEPIQGASAMWQNPGGGFGFGTVPVDASLPLYGVPSDLAWSLDGSMVPAPGALALLAAAGVVGARRRRA